MLLDSDCAELDCKPESSGSYTQTVLKTESLSRKHDSFGKNNQHPSSGYFFPNTNLFFFFFQNFCSYQPLGHVANVNALPCTTRVNAYFCLLFAVFHAIAITAFIAMSTGTASALYSGLHNMDRSTPLPPATIIPVGPFKLSTQPGKGSLCAGVTAEWNRFYFSVPNTATNNNNNNSLRIQHQYVCTSCKTVPIEGLAITTGSWGWKSLTTSSAKRLEKV